MKIVVLDSVALNPGDLSWDAYKEFGELTVYERTSEDEVVDRIGDAEIVLTNKTIISDSTMKKCPKLKYIGVNATGYNVVDIEAASKRRIIVTNVPEYGTDAVAQFTFALILELCNQVGLHNESVQSGGWKESKDFSYHLTSLMDIAGKTIGIIGFGNIGKKVSEIAHAFGMKVIVYSRTKKESKDYVRWVELDELFAESDIVSLHCPLTDDNSGFICENTINKMKDGAKLINTARGGLVVEEDLINALKSNKLSGAAVDVISTEPMSKDSLLLGIPNLIITPHIAWASHEARSRLMYVAVENVRAFLKGEPTNVINYLK